MRSSWKLFSIRGIDILLHSTFPLILIWAAVQYGYFSGGGFSGALFGIIVVSLLFVLVTLHELGHSFAAQYFGVPVERIVLLPIGGVAQLKRMPRKPIQEFIIALAGPAVNVVVALLMLSVAPVFNFSLGNFSALLENGSSLTAAAIFSLVFYYNIALAVFNMIPAFPMDGGRVLRSLLAMWLDYGRSTKIATVIGQILAVGMGFWGFFNGSFFLILIALFIFSGARQELFSVNRSERLRNLTVSHAYTNQPLTLSPYDNLQRAINLRRMGVQSEFPVVYAGQLMGFVTEPLLMKAISEREPWTMIKDIMIKTVSPVLVTTELRDVQERMQREQIMSLPVVEGTQFLGLITYRQIARLMQPTLRPDWRSGMRPT